MNSTKVTTRPGAAWLAGLVLGIASGFLVIEVGVVGLAFVAASIALIAWKGPRLLALGGLLTGFGGLWMVLFARVTLTCGADAFVPDPSCSTEDLTPWLVGSAAMLVLGLGIAGYGSRRRRR